MICNFKSIVFQSYQDNEGGGGEYDIEMLCAMEPCFWFRRFLQHESCNKEHSIAN